MMRLVGYLVVLLLGVLLVTGCSVDIDPSSSKTEKFASKAEEMGYKFMDVQENLEPLENKDTVTDEDQELIVEELGSLLEAIEEFKEEDASFIGKMANKIAAKEINQKESVLQEIFDKAVNREISEEDLKNLAEVLAPDFEINLLGK